MPLRSVVESLPEDVRRWLDQALMDNNFSGYEQLAAALREKGYEIGKSTLHRHGQKLERRLADLKASTDAAKLIVENASDDKDARSEAVMALLQTEIFTTLVNLGEASEEEDPKKRVSLLADAAHAVANVSRASVMQKKWRIEHQARVEAAAANVEKIARKGGLSSETVDALRREILGIAA
jgi:DNA-binding phage protein